MPSNGYRGRAGLRRAFELVAVFALGAGLIVVYHFAQRPLSLTFARLVDRVASGLKAAAGADCNIKGNVSVNTGERIYHVPGQMYYDATRIDSRYGERWFCSEAEARQAGWRKARR